MDTKMRSGLMFTAAIVALKRGQRVIIPNP
jgi:hypothetical protein